MTILAYSIMCTCKKNWFLSISLTTFNKEEFMIYLSISITYKIVPDFSLKWLLCLTKRMTSNDLMLYIHLYIKINWLAYKLSYYDEVYDLRKKDSYVGENYMGLQSLILTHPCCFASLLLHL